MRPRDVDVLLLTRDRHQLDICAICDITEVFFQDPHVLKNKKCSKQSE